MYHNVLLYRYIVNIYIYIYIYIYICVCVCVHVDFQNLDLYII